MNLPQIVYLQTLTACNGHCRYCPFDDVYGNSEPQEMSFADYSTVLCWLAENKYQGRIGFLLHYEPTLDDRLCDWIGYARDVLPGIRLEAATNGIIKPEFLNAFDHVDTVRAGSRIHCTSRAGNCKATPETTQRTRLEQPPCPVPGMTMCIAANGDVLLCCQDWRHEAVVGNVTDLTAARAKQLEYLPKVRAIEFEICRDCMAGKTAEEVGDRLGKRFIYENTDNS